MLELLNAQGSNTLSTVFYNPKISVTLENNLYSYGALNIYSSYVSGDVCGWRGFVKTSNNQTRIYSIKYLLGNLPEELWHFCKPVTTICLQSGLTRHKMC